MYRCGNCGGTFSFFTIPGKCPICGRWAKVKCSNCGFADEAEVFIQKGNRCPKCNKRVRIDGAQQTNNAILDRYNCPDCGNPMVLLVCSNCGHRRWFLIVIFVFLELFFCALFLSSIFYENDKMTVFETITGPVFFIIVAFGCLYLTLRRVFSKRPIPANVDQNSSFTRVDSANLTPNTGDEIKSPIMEPQSSPQVATDSQPAVTTQKEAELVIDVDLLIGRMSNFETRSAAAKQLAWMPQETIAKAVQQDWTNAVYMLMELYDESPRGEGYKTYSSGAERVAIVGKALNQLGGMDQMLEAQALFARLRPRAARNLEMLWDGVGNWQG